MVHPVDVKQLDYTKGIIITESGSTARYVIDTVEITHTVSWSGHLRSAFGLRGTISITEPGGVSLYDSILRSASALNIKNHMEATYLLSVHFVAEDEPEIGGELMRIFPYTWPVKVTNITSNIQPGGATYSLEFVEIGQQALESSASRISDGLTIDKVSTFEDFIDGFEEALNNTCENEKDLSVLVPDSYEIIYPEEWKNWKFENTDDPDRQDPFARSTTDSTKLTITIDKGTFVPDVLGTALGATTTFQKLLSDQSSSGEQSDRNKTDKQNLRTIKKFYRVQTDTEYGEFDAFRQDYSKKYIYKIISHLEPKVDASQARTMNPNIGDKSQSSVRLSKYKKSKLLKKVYAYTNTGLNNNVLNFNLNLNNAYFAIQPIYGGSTLTDLPGYKFDQDKSHKEEQLREDIKQLTAEIKSADAKQKSGNPNEAAGASATKEDKIKKRNNKFDELSSSVSTSKKQMSAPNTSNKDRVSGLRYAEMFQEDQNYLQEVNNYPVKYISQPIESQNEVSGFPGSRHRGRAIFNTTIINLSQLKELANIDIEITGDPYWFGAPNSIRSPEMDPGARSQQSADFELGSNMFFIMMNFPSTSLSGMDMSSSATTPTESSGKLPDMGLEGGEQASAENNAIIPEPWVKEANGLESIYCVTQVISRFSSGQFTQHLYGYRDNSINVRLIEQQIKQGIVVPVLDRTE
tara:strand:- start:476 stop:2548 length:2073 start_codon:yes stop_codon:yes gene_type:complete